MKIKLNVHEFISFPLIELFDIIGAKKQLKKLDRLKKYAAGKYPCITPRAINNGSVGFYDYYTEKGNAITFESADNGFCAYQPFNFLIIQHIEKLIPKFKMNKYIALFIVTLLNKEQFRFHYGRKRSIYRMKKMQIKLPCKDGVPDWEFMEFYMKNLFDEVNALNQ